LNGSAKNKAPRSRARFKQLLDPGAKSMMAPERQNTQRI